MAEPTLGEIRLMAFAFPPEGWALCNGAILQVAQNQALFSLIRNKYGGNGTTTFALPDLRGRVPAHPGHQASSIVKDGVADGAEGVVLTAGQMPIHNHVATGTSAAATAKKPLGQVWAATDAAITSYAAYTQTSTTTMNSQTVAYAGGGAAHSNMQPYTVLNYCIAVQGYYPQRP